MTTKRIVYTNDDGDCCIMIPLLNCGLTVEQIAEKDVPQGKSYRIIDLDQIPSDRTFRNAWTDEFDTDTVDVHVEKAKEIKKDELRAIRKEMLLNADVEYMKAAENKDEEKIMEIVQLKKELRDITKIELPDDIEELKSFIPDLLK